MICYKYLIFTCICLLQIQCFAAVKTNVATGNWSNAATWGGLLPAAGDEVIIKSGTIVSLNQVSVNSLARLLIEPGGTLRLSVNGSSLHISGDILNYGRLILWNSNAQKGTLFLHGESYWSGNGEWTLGAVNLGGSALEFDDFMSISFADNITGGITASINKMRRRSHTLFLFNGSENSSVPSDSDRYCYPAISIDKSASASRSLAFSDQQQKNRITLLGSLSIENSTDRLAIGAGNELMLNAAAGGRGTISGGQESRLCITGLSALTDTVRMTSGTSLYDLTINNGSGAVLQNSFTVRNLLTLARGSRLELPSDATLTIGVNGATPSDGAISGEGELVAGRAAGLVLRGNGSYPVGLNFIQDLPEHYTLSALTVSRMRGSARVKLSDGRSLIINGPLEIDTANILDLAGAGLYLNLTVTIRPEGCFRGSAQSSLYLQGTGGNATLRFDQAGPESARTLRLFQLERTSGRTIALVDELLISERVNIISGRLSSDGNLVLLSSREGSAAIDRLGPGADITGDVTVNCFFSGGVSMRGTRMVSSPIDDSSTALSVFQQLQQSMLITGLGGVANGFDAGGQTQPYAITIQTYKENAMPAEQQFLPLPAIGVRASASAFPGKGRGFFLFFRGNRAGDTKLNATGLGYAVPEDVIVAYKGPINKGDIRVALSYTGNPGDPYNGYNVLGNPYPSPIDWTAVGKQGVLDVVSVIKPGGGIATYSNGVMVNGAGLPILQAGQAFYARAENSSGSIKFTENSKSSAGLPPRFLKTKPATGINASATPHKDHEPDVLVARINKGSSQEETAIVPNNHAENTFDQLDASYFENGPVGIFSKSADGVRLAINFLPLAADSTLIPLFVTGGDGDLSISFPKVPAGEYDLFLQDKLTGTVLAISDTLRYRFANTNVGLTGELTARFHLLFKRKSFYVERVAEPVRLFPVPATNRISADLPPDAGQVRFAVYNLLGRKIVEGNAAGLDIAALGPGIYLAEIRTMSGVILLRKKFLKK